MAQPQVHQQIKKLTAEVIKQQQEGGAQCQQSLNQVIEYIAKTQEVEECQQIHKSAKSTSITT